MYYLYSVIHRDTQMETTVLVFVHGSRKGAEEEKEYQLSVHPYTDYIIGDKNAGRYGAC